MRDSKQLEVVVESGLGSKFNEDRAVFVTPSSVDPSAGKPAVTAFAFARSQQPSALATSMGTLAIASCLLYSSMSLTTILTNKGVLTSFGFTYAFSLLFWQHLVTVLAVAGARWSGYVSFEMPSRSVVLKWIPLNAIFCMMLLSNTYALRYMSIPMVTVIKSLSTALTGVGDYVFFGQRMSSGILTAVAIMVVSSVVAGFNDLTFNLYGYTWALINCVSSTAYVLYMKLVLKNTGVSEFAAVLLNNFIALPMLLPFIIYGDQLYPALEYLHRATVSFWLLFIVNGLSGFLLSLSSFWCVKTTSPTTYSMVGSLNKIPLTLIGWLLFSAPMTSLGVASVSTGLAGGILYTLAKARQPKT